MLAAFLKPLLRRQHGNLSWTFQVKVMLLSYNNF